MAFIDCSEQELPRPKDQLRRKLYYSGKKKKHTVKNLYAVNQKGLIIYKSKHKQIGREHDYKIYNKNHSRRRIVVEHAICRIKKYRIMNDVFRNRLGKYNRASDLVSGLVNYRIMNIC